MSEPQRTWISQFLIGLGLLVGFPAAFVSRLMLADDPLSTAGDYAVGLALAGFGIALVGTYIMRKVRNDRETRSPPL